MTHRGGMVGWELGRRLKHEGIYVYIKLIHFVIQLKLHNIVKRLYSSDKFFFKKAHSNQRISIFSKAENHQ